MSTQAQILQLDPQELTVHPALQNMPEWSTADERFLALVEDIRARGIDQPILVDAEHRIADGRHRWRAAKRLQLREVPVLIVPADHVATIILQSLLQRRHYTKSQRAFLSTPILQSARKEILNRQFQNLKNGVDPRASIESTLGKDIEHFARQLGFGRDLFFQAVELHRLFDKYPEPRTWKAADSDGETESKPLTFREYFEPRILDDDKPMGLGSAIRGITFLIEADKKGEHTGGKPKDPRRRVELFTESITTLVERFDYWLEADAAAQKAAKDELRTDLADLAPDRCKAIAGWLTTLAKSLRAQAKAAAKSKATATVH